MKYYAAEEEEGPATGSPIIPIGPAPPTDPSSSMSTSSSSSSALSSSSSSSSSLSSDELDSSGTAATPLPLSADVPTSPTTSKSFPDSKSFLSRNSEAMSSMAFAILDTSDRIPAISAFAFFDSANWSTNGAIHSPTISTSIRGHSPTNLPIQFPSRVLLRRLRVSRVFLLPVDQRTPQLGVLTPFATDRTVLPLLACPVLLGTLIARYLVQIPLQTQ